MKNKPEAQIHKSNPIRRYTSSEARRSAIARAMEIAARTGGEVIVHSSGGSIHVVQRNINAREAIRTELARAGALSAIWQASSDTKPPTDEELVELGELSQSAPSILDLVNEDRGGR